VRAGGQFQVKTFLVYGQPLLLQARGRRQWLAQPGQRRPAPQPERVAEQPGVAGRPPSRRQLLEDRHVQLVRADPQSVPVTVGVDQPARRGQHAAQRRHPVAHQTLHG
jgi:hypothetical protein